MFKSIRFRSEFQLQKYWLVRACLKSSQVMNNSFTLLNRKHAWKIIIIQSLESYFDLGKLYNFLCARKDNVDVFFNFWFKKFPTLIKYTTCVFVGAHNLLSRLVLI